MRTHKLLSEALVALLADQPFESISVKQICERAMVHRATFYTHFTDKYHLLRSLLNDIQEDLGRFQGKNAQGAAWNHHLLQFIEYVDTHRALFSLLLVEKDANSLTMLMRQRFADIAETQVKEFQAAGVRYSVPPPVIAQFFAGAVLAVIAWWLENDQPISVEHLTQYLDHLLSKHYEGPDGV
jgi:AcrR family transcriptional regulator